MQAPPVGQRLRGCAGAGGSGKPEPPPGPCRSAPAQRRGTAAPDIPPATHRPEGRRPRRSPSSSSSSSSSSASGSLSPQGCPTFLPPPAPALGHPAGLMGGDGGCPAHAWAPRCPRGLSQHPAPSPGRRTPRRAPLRCGGEVKSGVAGTIRQLRIQNSRGEHHAPFLLLLPLDHVLPCASRSIQMFSRFTGRQDLTFNHLSSSSPAAGHHECGWFAEAGQEERSI
ncbi:inactive phospholipid phosphatase 7 isoform X2 [Calypte anna]|uniref:inactive phospholipid phosphatase 7 isoform X2 n=1 Tax=Calypte anna TaxID=9244 RepID=UPI0011C4A640|nr:inactive phospholipid phosphatase 7 isoform X2 [Calypte anna]